MAETYLPSHKTLALRLIAKLSDTNSQGDIFSGWLVEQMDLAGAHIASNRVKKRVVTVGIEALAFRKPVFVGDEISCYGQLVRIGTTSLTVKVEVSVRRPFSPEEIIITTGNFTFVVMGEDNKPLEISKR
jgi:acyl-CoA thioesterase YciA